MYIRCEGINWFFRKLSVILYLLIGIISFMGQEHSEIVICMGSSCFSRGNKQALGIIKKYLKERGLEDIVLFRGSHCFGECEKGPVLLLNYQKHTQVTPDKVTDLLDAYFSGS